MLTTEEAQGLAEMRETLDAIQKRLTAQYVSETVEATGVNLYNLGRLEETITRAEFALFRVLNVASSYNHCEAADIALNQVYEQVAS